MTHSRIKQICLSLACVMLVASCSGVGGLKNEGVDPNAQGVPTGREASAYARSGGSSLRDVFKNKGAANLKVNRFLWTASLDVLDFLPLQTADPFTGVISTGYGRPPGGGRAYRATVLISDPALDARSLSVALQTQSGPVSQGTQRAVEDAILTRARQLRVNAGKF